MLSASDLTIFLIEEGQQHRVDLDLWQDALSGLDLADRVATSVNPSRKALVEALKQQGDNQENNSISVLYSTFFAEERFEASYQDLMQIFDADPAQRDRAVLIDDTFCKLMQSPLAPRDQAPQHMLFFTDDDGFQVECYAQAISVLLARTDMEKQQGLVDTTAVAAQDQMQRMRRLSTHFIKLDRADDAPVDRNSNIFAVGEPTIARIGLDNVGRDNPGRAGAFFRLDVDLAIYDEQNALVSEDLGYQSVSDLVDHYVPVDAAYFRTALVTEFQIDVPGNYQVVFTIHDRTRPEKMAVSVAMPVRVGLPDLSDMLMAGNDPKRLYAPDPIGPYALRRCAALLRSFHGRGRGTSEASEKVDFFLATDLAIQSQVHAVEEAVARGRTLQAVRDLTALYSARMQSNETQGRHPWKGDPLLARDEAGCDVIFGSRGLREG